jgi:hypothetical protein
MIHLIPGDCTFLERLLYFIIIIKIPFLVLVFLPGLGPFFRSGYGIAGPHYYQTIIESSKFKVQSGGGIAL